ncbi:MAG: hypothetical protein WCT03_06375 [Candidatus Obscuribacterales bacterium]|jgi:cytochrome c553
MNSKFRLPAVVIALFILAFVSLQSNPCTAKGAKASAKKLSGSESFKMYCASCHAGGGNKVDPNHPLAGSEQLVSIVRFKDYLSSPPGHMPYYESLVKDKATLEALYKYCKTMKKIPGERA